TERRPMYLSPDLAVPTSLPPPVAESLALTLRRISAADDTTAVSHDLASRFPPSQADPAQALGPTMRGRAGAGRASHAGRPGARRGGGEGPLRQLRGVGH